MRWWTFAVAVCLCIGSKADSLEQDFTPTSFGSSVGGPTGSRAWDFNPSEDATGNLIFQSLASLLQLAPNSIYPNGIHRASHRVISP